MTRLLIGIAIVGLAVRGQVGTATLRGSVVTDEGGRPMPGTLVTATLDGPVTRDMGPVKFSRVTDANGAFSFTGLPAATYIICAARMPDEEYVDSCAWTLTAPRTVLAAGSTRSGFVLRLEKGVRIDVTFDDPDGEMSMHGDQRKRRGLHVAVASRTVPPLPMHFSKASKRKMEYYLTVPRQAGMKVVAFSDDVDLGKTGEPPGQAKKNASEDLTLPPGQEKKLVEFRFHKKK